MCVSFGIRECVRKRLANRMFHFFFAVQRNSRIEPIPKDPQVIHSHDVIGMSMRHDGRANEFRSFSDKLQPQFRPGINHEFTVRCSNQYATAHSAISRIGRLADFAFAANDGNTNAGACAQNHHLRRREEHRTGFRLTGFFCRCFPMPVCHLTIHERLLVKFLLSAGM